MATIEIGATNRYQQAKRSLAGTFRQGVETISERVLGALVDALNTFWRYRTVEGHLICYRQPSSGIVLKAIPGTSLAEHIADIVQDEVRLPTYPPSGYNPRFESWRRTRPVEATIVQERVRIVQWMDRPDLSYPK